MATKKKLKVDLYSSLKKLDIIIRGLVTTRIMGSYRSLFKGKGLEFEDYRVYTPNDDASLIDWKATARSDEILIKEFKEERNVEVFFLIDASSSMVFGSTPKLKVEYTAEVVAALAYAILNAGDRVGFALFTDKIIKKVPAIGGERQFHILGKTLVDPDTYGGNFDFNEAIRFLLNYLKQTSVVIIVSDFIGLKNSDWVKNLKILSKKMDTIALMVRDPRDKTLLPETGQVVVADPYSKKELIIDTGLIAYKYEKEVKLQEKQIRDNFRQTEAELIELTTDKPFINPIIEMFKKREMRWR